MSTFKDRFLLIVRWLIAVFVVMFLVRLIYSYFAGDKNAERYYGKVYSDYFSDKDVRDNYATETIGLMDVSSSGALPADVKAPVTASVPAALQKNSQKYEKTATVKSTSSDFDADVLATRNLTRSMHGVIQYEQQEGTKFNREFHLLIGIVPESFDTFYAKIKSIGTLKATDVIKVDKTNEYLQLNAQKVSLQKTLESLNELKQRSGAIGDFVSLHDKILDIETQLQKLGVELGNFDSENEFCTVRLSMYEGEEETNGIMQHIMPTLEWTIEYYCLTILSAAGVLAAAFLLVVIADKIRGMAGK